MTKDFLNICLAMGVGLVLGAGIGNVGQRYVNEYVEQTCPKKWNHSILTISTPVVGQQKYCVDQIHLDF
jgi:lipoprotein signal peptidase